MIFIFCGANKLLDLPMLLQNRSTFCTMYHNIFSSNPVACVLLQEILDIISSGRNGLRRMKGVQLQINLKQKINCMVTSRLIIQGFWLPSSILISFHEEHSLHKRIFLFPLFVCRNGLIEGLQEKTDEMVDHNKKRNSIILFSPKELCPR